MIFDTQSLFSILNARLITDFIYTFAALKKQTNT